MVEKATFISDATVFLRDLIADNVTDPIVSTRNAKSRWVMTSYPEKEVQYPLITVRHQGSPDIQPLGAQSSMKFVEMQFQVRIWARNEKEKDFLTQQTQNTLNDKMLTASGSRSEKLHDLSVQASYPVDELGDAGIKSQILEITYNHILGS